MPENLVSLNPLSFEDIRLCERCLEDALDEGHKLSEKQKPDAWHETSIRFCVDGLYKWYKSYVGEGSVFSAVRDLSWHWMSFCCNDPVLSRARREYASLLKEITENTPYTDLADRMDEYHRFLYFGRRGRSFNISIPREASGVIGDTAVAIGTSFSSLLQVGLGWSLSTNRQGLYQSWIKSVFTPLFDEVMTVANNRLEEFTEIRNTLEFRSHRALHNSTI